MTAEESRVIGGLEAAVRNLERQAELNRAEAQKNFGEVFGMLRALQADGCARGKRNSDAIEEMQKGPDRAVARVSAWAAIMAAAAAVAAWWRG